MKGKGFILGALVGGIAAGVAVALTTPKKGSELRSDIKAEAEKLYEEGSTIAADTKVRSTEKLNEAKGYVNTKVSMGKEKINEKINKTHIDEAVDDVEEKIQMLKDKVLNQ